MASNYPPPNGYPENRGADGYAGGAVTPPPGYETVCLPPYSITPDGRYGTMPQPEYSQIPIHRQQQPPMIVNVDVHRPVEYEQGKLNDFVGYPPETPNTSQARFRTPPESSHLTPTAPLAAICPTVPELSVTEYDDEEEAPLLQNYQRRNGRDNRGSGRGQQVEGSVPGIDESSLSLLGTRNRDYRSITNRSRDGDVLSRDTIQSLAKKYRDGIKTLFYYTFGCSFVVFVIGILAILFPTYLTYYFGICEVVVGLMLMAFTIRICQQNKRELSSVPVGAVGLAKVAGFTSVVLLLSCCVSVCADAVFLATCTQLPHEYNCPEQWERLPINFAHALFRVASQGVALITAVILAITFYMQMHFLDKRNALIPFLPRSET